ncbi:hypothetical protein BRCON_1422 [Candidatus Sumerlaea chitinivorans]|uniref:Uncharacterized protein n=1 Tax=Sumerlaea chitinivorans TaxID=2250252 RepID=A0A2Z4Y5E6_SUMC1|nr:hypothetical protein BRCON_1422 [Candidatus Sumerlaea chitinivorans]
MVEDKRIILTNVGTTISRGNWPKLTDNYTCELRLSTVK